MLARIAGGWTLAVGLGLAGWTVRSAGSLPLALTIALLGTALLEGVVGVGMIRRSRAAWSFAISLTGVASLALLIALPAMAKSGTGLALGGLAAALVGGQLALLIMARRDLAP